MMVFVHSGGEIRIYNFSSGNGNKLDGVELQLASFHLKTKRIKSKVTFLRTYFLKLQIIRLVQGH